MNVLIGHSEKSGQDLGCEGFFGWDVLEVFFMMFDQL